ncbi:UDP-N-acetylmuramoyl-L-alanyl-D-glutamate--2,6-diaminopimelate ligase [Alkalimarinus sediminis]|uniref:UDP-N-acetylmuramoyl-L-alanyl-D-glutamate--2,6-diaminopimelate ligase n=1 Tax=Alkalimarinus sediminis TaxID=1632866 RepID=A0A9E8KMX6_9ALTE|nr:UDP-N-acetylmuramoyl-L-alanyl-D-glutamate--2,6-diaminopimelate ligase [Alkalimarinus sediminis]UZW73853.1 UDP-N-acetylmuramoyl-L-alanyl-D-glutamate--2,6-diaminopimelate ligase [Alkalimarinus sediminis]
MMAIEPREHTLSALLKGICVLPSVLDCRVYGIALDSRKVKKGDLFIALKGFSSSARAYIPQAIANGAVAVLVESDQETVSICEEGDSVELFVPGLKTHVGDIASRFFGAPSKLMKVVGVTGTNGKTSVSQYLAQVLSGLGDKTGVIGTLGYGLLDDLEVATHTTPDVVRVQQILANLKCQGASCAAMEVSSHGLDQGRVDDVSFAGAVFTNLSRDHLDYHGSMEAYGNAKKALFQKPGLSFAVINFDDEFGRELVGAIAEGTQIISYGISEPADIVVDRIQYTHKGIDAELSGPWGTTSLSCQLMGAFNLSNVMAVIGVAYAMGYKIEEICQAVAELTPVTGRMQSYSVAGRAGVVVDYAHTPDALKNALVAVRQHCRGKVWCVFGCGGDRDTGKRPMMAAIAETYADVVVVTDDNPRGEKPESIVADILTGFSDERRARVLHDRRTAIETCISSAAEEDMVLVAGKGHEDYQEVAGQRLEFSDIAVVESCLKSGVQK